MAVGSGRGTPEGPPAHHVREDPLRYRFVVAQSFCSAVQFSRRCRGRHGRRCHRPARALPVSALVVAWFGCRPQTRLVIAGSGRPGVLVRAQSALVITGLGRGPESALVIARFCREVEPLPADVLSGGHPAIVVAGFGGGPGPPLSSPASADLAAFFAADAFLSSASCRRWLWHCFGGGLGTDLPAEGRGSGGRSSVTRTFLASSLVPVPWCWLTG